MVKPDNTPKTSFISIPEGISQVTCITLNPSKTLMLVGQLASNPDALLEANQSNKMEENSIGVPS